MPSHEDATGATDSRDAQLRAEARVLHAALFGTPPADQVLAGYVGAHDHYCTDPAGETLLRTIVARRLDAEALELVLRRRHPILSRKCRMLVYLAESTPAGYRRLVNPTSRPVAGWFALVAAGLRTAWLYAKGHALVWRHRLG